MPDDLENWVQLMPYRFKIFGEHKGRHRLVCTPSSKIIVEWLELAQLFREGACTRHIGLAISPFVI